MKFFNNSWDQVLEDEFEKPYFKELMKKVDEEYDKYKVYPPREKVFKQIKLEVFYIIKKSVFPCKTMQIKKQT